MKLHCLHTEHDDDISLQCQPEAQCLHTDHDVIISLECQPKAHCLHTLHEDDVFLECQPEAQCLHTLHDHDISLECALVCRACIHTFPSTFILEVYARDSAPSCIAKDIYLKFLLGTPCLYAVTMINSWEVCC